MDTFCSPKASVTPSIVSTFISKWKYENASSLICFHSDLGDIVSQSSGSVLTLPEDAPFPDSCFPFRRLRLVRDDDDDFSSSETIVFTLSIKKYH
jgi:hypothetical protein